MPTAAPDRAFHNAVTSAPCRSLPPDPAQPRPPSPGRSDRWRAAGPATAPSVRRRFGALALAAAAALATAIDAPRAGTAFAQASTPMPAPPAAQVSTNLQVATASYLGSGGTVATAVDVAPDGTTVLGGVLVREPGDAGDLSPSGGPQAVSLLGGGNGVLVRLAGAGGVPHVLSVTRLGGAVEDVRVNGSGQIAACGGFGVAVLDSTAGAVQWVDRPGTVRRCAFADDGSLVALAGQSLFVYGPGGGLVASWSVGGTAQSDVALDASRGLVYATGHSNRRTPQGEPVQVAFLRAWTLLGVPAWTAYDAPANRLGDAVGDTRGVRISLGRDGKLYFAAESAGGNSLFSRQPGNPANALSAEQLVQTDLFTDPSFNTQRNHITWFGRYNPADGALEKGQFVLARLDDASLRGSSIRPRSIAADEDGRVYLAGATNASIQDRDVRTISGAAVGPYGGGEAFLLVVQPDLRQRTVWTTFTAPAPSGSDQTHESVATAVGVRNGIAALTATVSRGGLLTFNPLQAAPAGAAAPPAATPTTPARAAATASATSSGRGAPGTPTGQAAQTAQATETARSGAGATATASGTSGAAAGTSTAAPRTPTASGPFAGPSASLPGFGQSPPTPAGTPAAPVPADTLDASVRAYIAIWPRSGETAEQGIASPGGAGQPTPTFAQ